MFPARGDPGIARSDLRVIVVIVVIKVNYKIDLAPSVGASLEVVEADTRRMRPSNAWVFTNLRETQGVLDIEWTLSSKPGCLAEGPKAAISPLASSRTTHTAVFPRAGNIRVPLMYLSGSGW